MVSAVHGVAGERNGGHDPFGYAQDKLYRAPTKKIPRKQHRSEDRPLQRWGEECRWRGRAGVVEADGGGTG